MPTAPDLGGGEHPTATAHASEGTLASAEVVVGVSSKWAPPSVNVWKSCMPRATGEEMQEEEEEEEGDEKEKEKVVGNGG